MEEFGMDNFQLNFGGAGEFVGTNPFDEQPPQENIEETPDNLNNTGEGEPEETPEKDNIAENQEGSEKVGDEDGDDEGEGTSSDLYSSLAKVLGEQGLLPSLDINHVDKINNIDEFVKAFKVEQEAQAKIMFEDYINSLDVNKIAESKQVIDKLQDVDETYLQSNVEVAKNIIREDYKNQGFNDNQINRIINKLIDLGTEDLINEALTAKDSLVEIQNQKIQEEKTQMERQKANAIREQEELQANLKKTVFETKNLIDGYQPTPALRDKTYKSMTAIVGEDQYGNPINQFMKDRSEDPIGFETRMYMIYNLTDGFKNLKGLGGTAKTSAIKELENTFKNFNIKNDNVPAFTGDKESYYSGNFQLNI